MGDSNPGRRPDNRQCGDRAGSERKKKARRGAAGLPKE